jgi:hypothetical protein
MECSTRHRTLTASHDRLVPVVVIFGGPSRGSLNAGGGMVLSVA